MNPAEPPRPLSSQSGREFLFKPELIQKVLVQASSLCGGHVVLSLLLLPKLRGKKQAAGRRCCLCQEEVQKGRGGGRVGATVSTSHGPASPAPQLAGTRLRKAFALNLFLILCSVTSKAVSFAKAMKYGFESQGQALIECKWE